MAALQKLRHPEPSPEQAAEAERWAQEINIVTNGQVTGVIFPDVRLNPFEVNVEDRHFYAFFIPSMLTIQLPGPPRANRITHVTAGDTYFYLFRGLTKRTFVYGTSPVDRLSIVYVLVWLNRVDFPIPFRQNRIATLIMEQVTTLNIVMLLHDEELYNAVQNNFQHYQREELVLAYAKQADLISTIYMQQGVLANIRSGNLYNNTHQIKILHSHIPPPLRRILGHAVEAPHQEPEAVVQEPEAELQVDDVLMQEIEAALQEPETALQVDDVLMQEIEDLLEEPEAALQADEAAMPAPEALIQVDEGVMQEPQAVFQEPVAPQLQLEYSLTTDVCLGFHFLVANLAPQLNSVQVVVQNSFYVFQLPSNFEWAIYQEGSKLSRWWRANIQCGSNYVILLQEDDLFFLNIQPNPDDPLSRATVNVIVPPHSQNDFVVPLRRQNPMTFISANPRDYRFKVLPQGVPGDALRSDDFRKVDRFATVEQNYIKMVDNDEIHFHVDLPNLQERAVLINFLE